MKVQEDLIFFYCQVFHLYQEGMNLLFYQASELFLDLLFSKVFQKNRWTFFQPAFSDHIRLLFEVISWLFFILIFYFWLILALSYAFLVPLKPFFGFLFFFLLIPFISEAFLHSIFAFITLPFSFFIIISISFHGHFSLAATFLFQTSQLLINLGV